METYEKHSGRYPWGSDIYERASNKDPYMSTEQPHIPVNTNAPELYSINDVLVSMNDKHNATYNTLKRILYILNNTDPNDFPPTDGGSKPEGMLGWISMNECKASFINNLVNEIACLLGVEDN